MRLLPLLFACMLATCAGPGLDFHETLSYGGAAVSYNKVDGKRFVNVGIEGKQVVETLKRK